MKFNDTFFLYGMIIVLLIIGLLPFFNLPPYSDAIFIVHGAFVRVYKLDEEIQAK